MAAVGAHSDGLKVPDPTARTGFVCQHPYARRRTYKVRNGQVEAECEVCWSCAAVRSQAGGFWLPASYVYQAGDLLELDGRVRIPGYFAWMRRAPVE